MPKSLLCLLAGRCIQQSTSSPPAVRWRRSSPVLEDRYCPGQPLVIRNRVKGCEVLIHNSILHVHLRSHLTRLNSTFSTLGIATFLGNPSWLDTQPQSLCWVEVHSCVICPPQAFPHYICCQLVWPLNHVETFFGSFSYPSHGGPVVLAVCCLQFVSVVFVMHLYIYKWMGHARTTQCDVY